MSYQTMQMSNGAIPVKMAAAANFVLVDNPAYRADVEELVAVCADRNVAVQTIQAIARGHWTDASTPHFSWYDPLTEPAAIASAVRFVLSHPQMFVTTTSGARLLPLIVEVACGDLSAPSADEMRADIAEHGITLLFDGQALERI